MNKLKIILKYRLPVYELVSHFYSYYLHLKYSFPLGRPKKSKESQQHYLMKLYHIVEKGLALPNPRPGFGEAKIKKLLIYAKVYQEKYGRDWLVDDILSALKDYVDFNIREGSEEFNIVQEVQRFISSNKLEEFNGRGGVNVMKSRGEDSFTFESLLESRKSIRFYDDTPLQATEILSIIKKARFSPSVCNRQGWKCYIYDEKQRIHNLLSFQNGNRGFSEFPVLLLITGRVEAFSRFEHNQLFIDAGLFSMNVLNSLADAGLGSCPLNLALTFEAEVALKREAGIPASERPVMMISVGHFNSEILVANSPRFKTSDVFKVNYAS